jgi:hypothetical protein
VLQVQRAQEQPVHLALQVQQDRKGLQEQRAQRVQEQQEQQELLVLQDLQVQLVLQE